MPTVELDHLIIGCLDLAAGAAATERHLGGALGPGGAHPIMETHNRLMPLAERIYLEVIAPIPERKAERPRWFGLDDPATRAALAVRPRLVAFAVRTDDIAALAARLPASPGTVHRMSRGSLAWQVAIPDEGLPVAGGAIPLVIAWEPGRHPLDAMGAPALALESLVVRHPEPGFAAAVAAALGLSHLRAEVGAAGLSAVLTDGRRRIILD